MKKVILGCAILFSLSAGAQNYSDSNITVTLTQRASYWIATHVKNTFGINSRTMPDVLEPYVGSGLNPDSVFSVTLQAKYITGLIELLFSTQTAVTIDDYNSIIYNTPSVVGYTALATQVVTKANGASNQKQVAQFIVNYFNTRKSDFDKLRTEYIKSITTWTKQ